MTDMQLLGIVAVGCWVLGVACGLGWAAWIQRG